MDYLIPAIYKAMLDIPVQHIIGVMLSYDMQAYLRASGSATWASGMLSMHWIVPRPSMALNEWI